MFPRSYYTVAWICPLAQEQTAAMAMLDEIHQVPPTKDVDDFDPNAYTCGSIDTATGTHYVVMAVLRAGFPDMILAIPCSDDLHGK